MSLLIKKFGATWCAPCKQLDPIINKLAIKYNDVVFETIDIDEDSDQAMDFGVSAVPTLVFIKDGQVVDKTVGVHSESSLSGLVDQHRG